MYDLLKKIFDAQAHATYLFPSTGQLPITCQIIDLKTTRVTFAYQVGDEQFNIVTHPNHVAIIEKK